MTDRAEQLRRSWLANAEAWTDAVRNDRIESRRTVTNDAIVNAVLDQHGTRVLDVGCGEGWLARELAERGRIVTAFDASAPLIAAAQELGGADFFVLGYDDLIAGRTPFVEPFDIIVANFALLDDRAQELLAALRGTLARDGRMLIQTVHPLHGISEGYVDGWRTETFAAFPGQWPEEMPWFFRTLGSWMSVIAAAGFRVVEIREPLHRDRNVPASLLFVLSLEA